MGKGPGLYSDIGKKARELLYKDYQSGHSFSISTFSPNGVAITSSGVKTGDMFYADVNTLLMHKNVTTNVKVDTDSNLFTIITVDEAAPGLKTIFSFIVPDQRSGKVEVQYLHENAGISTSIGLTGKPTANFSSVVGSNNVALGSDLSFDTENGILTKCNAAVSFSDTDFVASLSLNNNGDTVNTSYHHTVNPLKNTAIGAEFTHCFSSSESTLMVGAQHALDPLTLVKARVNNFGTANALIQHQWRPKSLLTISAEANARAIEKTAKFGLALALTP